MNYESEFIDCIISFLEYPILQYIDIFQVAKEIEYLENHMKLTSIDAKIFPSDEIKKKLRVVVLDCAYDTIQHPRTLDLLGKIMAMKVLGYQSEYPYGVLPIDTSDFVGVHILLCEENGTTLEPLMGFKSITAQRCKIHNLPFPVFNILSGADLPDHRKALEIIMHEIQEKNEQVAYNSSWTIHPDIRHNPILRQLCIDMTAVFLLKYYEDYKIPHVLAGATLRFKVDRLKKFVGFEHVTLNGTKLANFECKPFFGETVSLMYMNRFRDEARFWANRYKPYWENRITIANSSKEAQIKIAA